MNMRRTHFHPWSALMHWVGGGLANRLTLSVLLGATVMLAVVGGSSYLAMTRLLERSIQAELASQKNSMQDKLEAQLGLVTRTLVNTANSPFVGNGLTDADGRDAYLVPFLRDHEAHVQYPLSLVLVDFKGRPVCSGKGALPDAGTPPAPVVRAALASGRPQATLRLVDGQTILEVVQPVVFAPTQSVEGALVGDFHLGQMFHELVSVLPPKLFHRLRGASGEVEPGGSSHLPKDRYTLLQPLQLKPPLQSLGLVLELGEDRAAIFAPLQRVVHIYLACGALLLFLAYFFASLLGRHLAAPISALSREAAAISAGGELTRLPEVDGRDEIAVLTQAIGTMVEHLSQARETLEAKVQERTRELRDSQVLLGNIVENIPHAVGVRDLRRGGEIVLWNRAAEQIFGIDREAALAGQMPPLQALFIEEHGGRGFPLPGEIWDGTRMFLHPRQQRQVYLQTKAMTLADGEGNPGHLLVIADDISARQRAEEAIRLDRLRFEVLYQLSQMGQEDEDTIKDFALEEAVRITDSSIGYLYFLDETESVLRLHAWSGQVMPMCRVENPPRDYQVSETGLWGEAVRQRRATITNDYAADNPWKKGLPEGHVPLVRHMNVPLIDNGRIVLLAGVGNKTRGYDESDVRHLTLLMDGMWRVLQRKRAEQSLRRSEVNYRSLSQEFLALLAGIPDRITLLDPNLQVVWSNQDGDIHALEGWRRPGRDRKLCFQFWYELAEICDECPPSRCFLSGRQEQGQIETTDGRIWDVRAIPIRDEAGKVVNVIELGQDITDRIRAQEQTIRSAHLASLGELAAGVAHEINNPINGIINYAQVLADRLAGMPPGADLATRIIHEGERISAIVRNLLTFARPEGGSHQVLDVATALQDSLALLSAQMRREHVECRVEIEPSLPPVAADSGQLRQVLLNVINNARYALNEKYPGANQEKVLDIKVGRAGSESEKVRIVVIDYGSGIQAEILDRVMNPFFTTKPVGKGTGLGLSISHGIIAAHGGSLKLESVAGQFTRVRIDLPVAPAKEHQ